MKDAISILPLDANRRDIKRFVKSAWNFYRGNQYWVPPIIHDQVNFILKGSYNDIGVMQPFLACRNGEIVGRILAHIDNRHNEYFNEKRGCIGFFESIHDTDVSRALFHRAGEWLRERGMETMQGPYNFILYDASGILMDDYEAIPPLELGYTPPYYPDLFSDYGFEKSADWYAYLFSVKTEIPRLFVRMWEKLDDKARRGDDGLVFRNINLNSYEAERDEIKEIFNRAWENNWGHYPLSDSQIESFGKDLKRIAREELIIFAEYNGSPAGFILSIPDVNPAIRRAGGRLYPLGIFRILLGMRKIKRIKTMLMGVLPEYRMRGLDAYFYVETFKRAAAMGYNEADLSLIVENNLSMINALEHFGARRYKTYRFFRKTVT